MKIDRITYRKTFNLGNFTYESIGVEMELNENDNPTAALDECKKFVEQYHKDNTPEEFNYSGAPTKEIDVKQEMLTQTESIIRDINSCTDPKVLDSYRIIAKTKPEIQQAYDAKLKTFQ